MKKLIFVLLTLPMMVMAESLVLEDDFKDLSQWVGYGGEDNSIMFTSIETDPFRPNNKVARFNRPVNAGDIFSRRQFQKGKYRIIFDYLGTCRSNCGATLGLDAGKPSRSKEQWLASTAYGFPIRLKDTKKWEHYEFEFNSKFDFYLKWEQWDSAKGEGKDAYIDNLKLINLDTITTVNSENTPLVNNQNLPTTSQSLIHFDNMSQQRSAHIKDLERNGIIDKITVLEYEVTTFKNNRCVISLNPQGKNISSDVYLSPIPANASINGLEDNGDGGLFGLWNQLKQLKKKYSNLKVIISLSDKNLLNHDSALPSNRAIFAKSCIETFIKGNIPNKEGVISPGLAAGIFDGFNIDWEYPLAGNNDSINLHADDSQNYTALIAEFRKQIDAIRPGYLITITAPAMTKTSEKIELEKISPLVNWINLKAFDFSGPTSMVSKHHATLIGGVNDRTAIDIAVDDYLNRGVPSNKILLGVPFYGYAWEVTSTENNGIYQKIRESIKGPNGEDAIAYSYIKTMPGKIIRDRKSRAVWKLYGNNVVVYDDVQLLKEKIEFAKKKNLGGIMAWELSQDTPDIELVDTIYKGMIKK